MPAPKGPASPVVGRKPSLDFSLTGLIFILMMLFMGLAAVHSQANLLFGVFGLMGGVLLVSLMISRLVLRRLDVRRRLPDHAVVGKPATLQYELRNDKRFWPSLSVSLHELDSVDAFGRQPQAYMLHAAATVAVTLPVQLVPVRRGLHRLDRVQFATSFPFGFIKRAAIRKRPDALLVYPPIGTVDGRLLERCLSAELTTSRMRPRPGGTDEFYGVKEFRGGDNPRWINWRRTARTGKLVANEMTQVSPPRLLIVLDTHQPEESGPGSEAIERAIAMAASLIDHALARSIAVGLRAWSNHLVEVRPSRGKRHRAELMTVLARLPANRSFSAAQLTDGLEHLLRTSQTAVIVSPSEPELGLLGAARGRIVVLSAESREARQWFAFDEQVDFAACAPRVEK